MDKYPVSGTKRYPVLSGIKYQVESYIWYYPLPVYYQLQFVFISAGCQSMD